MSSDIPHSLLPTGWGLADTGAQLDFNDHRNFQKEILWINVIFISLLSLVVGLRFFTRIYIVRYVFLDDVLILCATVFTLVTCGVAIIASKYSNLGRHIWDIGPAEAIWSTKESVRYLYMIYIFYSCAIAFTKLSIICAYLRLLPSKTFRLIMHVTAAVVIAIWISSVFGIIFQCYPIAAAWDFGIPNRKCINYVTLLFAMSGLGIVTDLILIFVPIPLFWKLQLPTRQKAVLISLFLFGAVACVASIVRTTTLRDLAMADITFNSVGSVIWSVLECALGIICVSAPSLRALILYFTSPKSLAAVHQKPQFDASLRTARGSVQITNLKQLEQLHRRRESAATQMSDDLTVVGERTRAGSKDIWVSYEVDVDYEIARSRRQSLMENRWPGSRTYSYAEAYSGRGEPSSRRESERGPKRRDAAELERPEKTTEERATTSASQKSGYNPFAEDAVFRAFDMFSPRIPELSFGKERDLQRYVWRGSPRVGEHRRVADEEIAPCKN